MIAPYSFHQVASAEFNEAAGYYDAEHRGLGSLFVDAVVAAISQVREHPNSCPVLRDRNRRMLVNGFPYSVVYSFVLGHVRILAVAHHSRRPYYWSERQ